MPGASATPSSIRTNNKLRLLSHLLLFLWVLERSKNAVFGRSHGVQERSRVSRLTLTLRVGHVLKLHAHNLLHSSSCASQGGGVIVVQWASTLRSGVRQL